MVAVFDTEQWSWRRAYKMYKIPPRTGMDNAVAVRVKGKWHEVLVVIPTAFVAYLRDIHGPDVDYATVSLYAGPSKNGFVFGYTREVGTPIDLWYYPKLPAWLDPAIESVT